MVRDTALALGGLLNPEIGGPSVRPYQPEGYWEHLNFPKRKYAHDKNASQYRRGLYVHWQRSFLHPSMKAFDAPSREVCTVRRIRSNTPLQALVTLNDPVFVEAAQALARRMVTEQAPNNRGVAATMDPRIVRGFSLVVGRRTPWQATSRPTGASGSS